MSHLRTVTGNTGRGIDLALCQHSRCYGYTPVGTAMQWRQGQPVIIPQLPLARYSLRMSFSSTLTSHPPYKVDTRVPLKRVWKLSVFVSLAIPECLILRNSIKEKKCLSYSSGLQGSLAGRCCHLLGNRRDTPCCTGLAGRVTQ